MATTAGHAAGMLGRTSKRVGPRALRTPTVLWVCCLASGAHMTTGGAQKVSSDERGRAITAIPANRGREGASNVRIGKAVSSDALAA